MKYTLEGSVGGDDWRFIKEFDNYTSAAEELARFRYTRVRIRVGNELIAMSHYEKDELTEWRRRHIA